MITLASPLEDETARACCEQWGNKPANMLEILHAVQREAGYVSERALRTIARSLNLSRAEVYGVATFYHDFRLEKGASKTIKICRAEACQAVGANELVREAEATFGSAQEPAYCLGNCALGPAVMVDGELYGRVDGKRLAEIAKKHGVQG